MRLHTIISFCLLAAVYVRSTRRYVAKNGEIDATVYSIYKDKQSTLWLGTHHGGAYKFNGEAFEKFNLLP